MRQVDHLEAGEWLLQRTAPQESLTPVPDACQDGVIGAERQTSNLPVHVDRLDERKREEIWVNLEHMDLELGVRMG